MNQKSVRILNNWLSALFLPPMCLKILQCLKILEIITLAWDCSDSVMFHLYLSMKVKSSSLNAKFGTQSFWRALLTQSKLVIPLESSQHTVGVITDWHSIECSSFLIVIRSRVVGVFPKKEKDKVVVWRDLHPLPHISASHNQVIFHLITQHPLL